MSTPLETLQATVQTLDETVGALTQQATLLEAEISALQEDPGEHTQPVLVARPSITAPTEETTVESLTLVSASPFALLYGGEDGSVVHAASDWEISMDSHFTTRYWHRDHDTDALTTINPQAQGLTLPTNSAFYVRVRYETNTGMMSQWSLPLKLQSGLT
jgi:hypothetical protein